MTFAKESTLQVVVSDRDYRTVFLPRRILFGTSPWRRSAPEQMEIDDAGGGGGGGGSGYDNGQDNRKKAQNTRAAGGECEAA